MKHTFKKSLAVILATFMLLTVAPMTGFIGLELPMLSVAYAEETKEFIDGGTTEDGLSWAVYDNGELVISGEGEMQDYFTKQSAASEEGESETIVSFFSWVDPAPWTKYIHDVTSVTVEDGITSIGCGAFRYLYMVNTLSLSDSIKIIKDSAFDGCISLEIITLPCEVETIGCAFQNCFSLKELIIPGTAKIDLRNFTDSPLFSLEKLILEEGATAFYSEGAENEDEQLYLSCSLPSLTYLSVPSTIDNNVILDLESSSLLREIYNCSMKMTVIFVPHDLIDDAKDYYKLILELNKMQFITLYLLDCGFDLSDVKFDFDRPAMRLIAQVGSENIDVDDVLAALNELFDYEFSSFCEFNAFGFLCEDLMNYSQQAGGCTLYCYENSSQHELIKKEEPEFYVRHFLFDSDSECIHADILTGEYDIWYETWNGEQDITVQWEIDLENRVLVLDVDGDAFGMHHSLSALSYLYDSIVFTDDSNFTTIGGNAFAGVQIKEFTIPSTVQIIENHAFDGCTALETIYIPKDSALKYYKPIMGDVLENKFNSCINHTAFVVEEGNPTYSSYDGALYNADGTELLYVPQGKTTIDIADTTKNIALFAFYMSHVETVTIPDSVESLELAFILNWVKTINIGSGVSSIPTRYGGVEFIQCFNLEEINVDVDNEYYASDENGILFNKDKTELIKYPEGKKAKSYTVPAGVTTIGTNAFYIVECLSKITLSEGVEIIKVAAFDECWAKEISLPESLKEIQYNAFCSGAVSEIVIPANVEKVGKGAFESCVSLEKITFLNPDTYIFDGDTYSTDNEYYYVDEFGFEDFIGGYSDGSNTIPQETVIYGYADSTAEAYALKYNRVFVALSDCSHTGGTATCESKAICSLCGQEYGELGDHAPSTFTQPESCTVNGYILTVCDLCGEQLSFETIPSAHAWGEWIEIKTATCVQVGEETRTCGRCGETESRETSIGDHDFSSEWTIDVDSTCSQEGSQSRHCKYCSATTDAKPVEKKEHSFGEWYVVTEPTLLADGKKERKCSACPATEEEATDKLLYKEYVNEETGIAVGVTKEAYGGKDITVEIAEVFDGSQFVTNSYGKIRTWNIKTHLNGELVQPLEPVYIRIPLPADYNANRIFVYHVNSQTGVSEKLTSEVIDGYICFYTDSFSRFIIVDESSLIETPDPDDPDVPDEPDEPTKNCSHLCHNDGIMGFFWKIIRFFWKLFNMNPVCECGAAHY